ncbi:MAG: TRAP transporter large permease subunit, partial [Alphaproteobacteria bacterium]|nr:TRAP transporter large permease subunit [Alphaproteobacteria bacterium]
MEWYWTLALLLGSILFLMFIGLPVGLAFILVNTVAAVVLFGRFGDLDINMLEGIHQLTDNAFANITIFAIVPIPMFLLMGEMFFHTGLANKMFNAVEQLMGRVPARLSYVTVAGGTVFATLSGSSMGSTALLGTLMIPEMSERGYKKKMSIGPILGTGGLAMLIPPSALAVLLGTLAELDIGRLLIAGIIPGLILASFYIVLIFVQATLDKDAAPAYDVVQVPLAKRLALVMTDVVPMISVIVMVILLIMFGIATPSESAAYGSLGVILLSIIYLFIVPLLRGDVAAAKAFWPQFGRALWRSMWGAGR